jgi:hypothetical protein
MTLATLKTKIYFLTKTNSTSFGTTDIEQAINNAVEHVVALINKADSRWQWDDNNQTDLPIATTTLTSGQQDYSLSTAHLTIDRIEVKDSAGDWHLLKPIDQQVLKGDRSIALAEYKSTTGLPEEYDIIGSSVILYPTPNYTQAASLKFYFTRGPVALSAAGDIPGFNSLFHDLPAYIVSYEYAVANGLPSANGFFAYIQRREQELNDFYGGRHRDERPRLTVSGESNK